MVAKTFQLPYTAVLLLPLKLQKINCATRAFNKFRVLQGGIFVFLNKADIATFVIQLYSIFSKTQ